MNIKKVLILAMLVAGLGSALSLNTQQPPQCRGHHCPRPQGQVPQGPHRHHPHPQHPHHQHPHHPHARPIWKEVPNMQDAIDVQEGDNWVRYTKGTKKCPPPMAHGHPHGHWKGHPHGHGHWQGHQHGRPVDHRHVKYQFNDKHEKIDGVLNVWEKGECWEYARTTTQQKVTPEEKKLSEEELNRILEEALQPD